MRDVTRARKAAQRVLGLLLAVIIAWSWSIGLPITGSGERAHAAGLAPTASGKIELDGGIDDWEGVRSLASNDSYVADWKLARDIDGNVYFMATGTAVSQWDYNFQWKYLAIYQNGNDVGAQLTNLGSRTGGEKVEVVSANFTTPGPWVFEAVMPASYFTDANATFSFMGTTVSLGDIAVLDGEEAEEADPVYEGITIDGSFKDWAAVTKYPAWCDNSAHQDCIDQTAVVWDGDYLYVYIEEAPGGSAAGAGSHGNGLYQFVTDLGRYLQFQLNNDGSVSGAEGAIAKHVGSQWEIAIPATDLPPYLETISFGLYLDEGGTFITDIANLNGQGSGGSFAGIVIDGQYGDWEYYPHSIIEYATAGTQAGVPDSEGALYSENGMLYAHVVTTMPAHVDYENGGEFLAAVSVAFNNDRDYKGYPQDGNFYPKFFTVADDGAITVVNEGTHLQDGGPYKFYIADTRTDFSSRNFYELDESEYFGFMYVTIEDGKDEMEFEIDLGKVAAYIGADANDMKVIESQFGRLGQQWITTAGTSTAPFLGIGLGLAVVAGVLGYRRIATDGQKVRFSAGRGTESL